jgi:virginiamycin B lyase
VVTNEFVLQGGKARPRDIVAGPDGALWFTQQQRNTIGRISTAGAVTEYGSPAGLGTPLNIVSGPDGALWFTEAVGSAIGRVTTAGQITTYQTPSSNSEPLAISVGGDGNLWFTETAANAIGQITPGGQISEYPVQTPHASLAGITRDTAGNLVFLEAATSRLVTLDLTTVVNDTDAGVLYSGSWRISSNRPAGDYGGDVHYTTTNGDAVTYAFTGTSISFITEKSADEGQIAVYVEGVVKKTVNASSAGHNLGGQVVYSISGLSAGPHLIKLTKVSGQYMLVDAFRVK